MELVLKEDIANLGKIGEVVRVRDGYARNYLLPRGLVLVANKKNNKTFEHQKKLVADQKQKIVRQAQAVGDELAGVSLVIPTNTSSGFSRVMMSARSFATPRTGRP